MHYILQPWPWYVSGPLIALVMLLLLFAGRGFGMSSNLRTFCSMGGAGKVSDFFKFNWRDDSWNLMVVVGAIFGGLLASQYLSAHTLVDINEATKEQLKAFGFTQPGDAYLPAEIFSYDALFSLKGFGILALGGLLIGFGSRYAGGCTSGHAISGLSNLQMPSLIAVMGFFIGGLTMTHFILPILLTL